MSKILTNSVAVLLLFGALGACSRTIGDACVQNVDCSIAGDRFCDIASPAGYCTIEGCDWNTCPDGAACVRFFDLLRGAPVCDARASRTLRADCPTGDSSCCRPGDGTCCLPGEQCLCEAESCTRAYCASETSERRWCMRPCDEDSDCREGYRCYMTGENGAQRVPRPGVPLPRAGEQDPDAIRFCAPAPQF